jgi:hypothetical protein
LESQDEESEDSVEKVPHQNNPETKSEQQTKEQKNPENTVKGKEAPLGGSASSHGKDPDPVPVDRTPNGVFVAPLDPSVGVEKGDGREGEDSKSPSFAEILKKNPCPSPPLTRGRKENKNRKDKEATSGNSGGSQRSVGDIAYSDGIAWIVS